MRGVPLRVEIGPRDVEQSQVVVARRDTRAKASVPMEGIAAHVSDLLETVQANVLARAVAFREAHTVRTTSGVEFRQLFEERPGFVVAPWCGGADCEAQIKTDTQATIRNLPLEATEASGVCVQCGKPGVTDAWFAKAY